MLVIEAVIRQSREEKNCINLMRVYLPLLANNSDEKWEELPIRANFIITRYKQFRFCQERQRTHEKWLYWVGEERWRHDGS